MNIRKEIKDDNEFYLWFNGQLIFKKWLNQGYSKVFDRGAWGKYTEYSITDFDLKETPSFFEVKSKLSLVPISEGGRKTAIVSGYRPDHVFEYEETGIVKYAFIGDIQLNEIEQLEPGNEAIVTIRFLTHQPIEKHLQIGQVWWIHEGQYRIGEAKAISIKLIDSDIEQSDKVKNL